MAIDEERRIGFVNFGEIEASHFEAVAFMRKYAEVRIPRRFKTIVTTPINLASILKPLEA